MDPQRCPEYSADLMNSPGLPSYDILMNPVLQALRDLGGSGTIEEINSRVIEIAGLSDEEVAVPHPRGRGSEVEYRLAWTRTYLKTYGLLENSSRGVWSLTNEGRKIEKVEPREVVRFVAAAQRSAKSASIEVPNLTDDSPIDWQEQLLDALLNMQAGAFERLAQRILRESGFIQVEVTGRTGDGGIDGNGVLRLNGLLSFHVSFQCKRWQGAVGPATIREFRGAMMGRADKGLIITTGSFTKEALREATREGAAAIDLVDGNQLVMMLKTLGLGVATRQVEEVTIEKAWFESI
jgi:restriction system protein